MRKYLIAAAAAGGLLLLGGGPAYAGDDPAPSGPLGGVLDPAGGINLDSPLSDSPLVKVKPGTNTPELPALPTSPASPTEGGLPAARTGMGGAEPSPAAEVAGGAPRGALPAGDFSVANVPVGSMLRGGGLTALGLMPDGSSALAAAPASVQESGLLDDDVPLLGGLGGLLREPPPQTLPAGGPDTSGMPAGGTAVGPPVTTPAPASSGPATTAPDPSGPGDDDKRLHEEPIDNEAGGGRTFSDGRPVAGEDPDYT